MPCFLSKITIIIGLLIYYRLKISALSMILLKYSPFESDITWLLVGQSVEMIANMFKKSIHSYTSMTIV